MFTTLGKGGTKWPVQIGSHYAGQDHDGQVTLSSGIQQWTVPHTGEYRIEAIGALGGYGEDSIIKNGGRGARMIGNLILTKDEIIHILVGQKRKKGGRCWSPKCNNCPKCNKVLNVITFGPKCNKVLNVIKFSPKCNKPPMQSFDSCSALLSWRKSTLIC